MHGLSPSPAPCASREVCRRAAVWPRQPAGSRTRPASRGTLRATAVKPRPAFMSPEQPRAQRARSGVKGYCPLREPRGLSPSGGNPPANFHVSRAPCGAQSGVKGYYPLREPRHPPCHSGKTPASIHVSRAPCAPVARSPGSRGTTPCASRETRCRAAVWPRQPAGSRTRPASREACRRAAVKPRPAFMSPEHPARLRRAVRGAGGHPLLKEVRSWRPKRWLFSGWN